VTEPIASGPIIGLVRLSQPGSKVPLEHLRIVGTRQRRSSSQSIGTIPMWGGDAPQSWGAYSGRRADHRSQLPQARTWVSTQSEPDDVIFKSRTDLRITWLRRRYSANAKK